MISQLQATGGTSPFKRRTSRTKAGNVGKKATATKAQDKSGYSRSGKEGVNTPSFTPNTRVTSSLVESIDKPQPSKTGKDSKSGKTQIGTDASGAPIYNYYGNVFHGDVHQEQNINVNNASGGTTKKKRKVYPTEDQVCHPDYLVKHGKGGPGSPECEKYKEYRKNNPRKSSNDVVQKDGDGMVIINANQSLDAITNKNIKNLNKK
tara:strand:+ start:338 stop:955 length:618 start_codon:yes stop_codon:yes gene_type:complete